MKKITCLLLCIHVHLVFAQSVDPVADAKRKFDNKDFTGAKADLTKIINADAKNKKAFVLRGRVRMALEDYYGAIGDLNSALEMDSTQADAFNYRGEAKINLGDDDGAIADLNKAIRFNG